jgi:hypothetical protein
MARTGTIQARRLDIVDLDQIVRDFALAMEVVDHRQPRARSHRDATRSYQPGIGPFAEDDAVSMTLKQMQAGNAAAYLVAGKRRYRYPVGNRTCDLALGKLPDWVIDVKLARLV